MSFPKSRIFPILGLVICIAACQEVERGKGGDTTKPHIDTTVNTKNFYRHFEGAFEGSNFELHLLNYNNHLQGTLIINRDGLPIQLWPIVEEEPSKNVYLLSAYNYFIKNETEEDIRWRIRNTGSGWTAQRLMADGKQSLELPLTETNPFGAMTLSAFSLTDTALFTEGHAMPRAIAGYNVALPNADDPRATFAASAIRSIMGFGDSLEARSMAAWQEGLETRMSNWFAAWRADLDGIYTLSDSLSAFAYNYEQKVLLGVTRNDRGWLVLQRLNSSYTGGAHGNTVTTYYNLDLQLQKVWNLADIVTDSESLSPLLNSAAYAVFGIKRGSDLSARILVSDIPPTGNICVLSTGLSFIYNPYEIAPYADGEVHLFLPWQQVQLLLTPAFRERMKLIRKQGQA